MLRTLSIVLLATGTVLGFGAGFAHLCGYGPHGHYGHHGHWGHGFYDRCGDATPPAAPSPPKAP